MLQNKHIPTIVLHKEFSSNYANDYCVLEATFSSFSRHVSFSAKSLEGQPYLIIGAMGNEGTDNPNCPIIGTNEKGISAAVAISTDIWHPAHSPEDHKGFQWPLQVTFVTVLQHVYRMWQPYIIKVWQRLQTKNLV